MSGHTIRDHHTLRSAMLLAALAGVATALRWERTSGRSLVITPNRAPRIGETALGEPGEVLWFC